jgi:hypothetical protein
MINVTMADVTDLGTGSREELAQAHASDQVHRQAARLDRDTSAQYETLRHLRKGTDAYAYCMGLIGTLEHERDRLAAIQASGDRPVHPGLAGPGTDLLGKLRARAGDARYPYSAKQLASALGISKRTLDSREADGVLPPAPARVKNRHGGKKARRYGQDHLQRCQAILSDSD